MDISYLFMSVQDYLNEKFPGLESLKGGVDVQTASLKQRDEELVLQLDQLKTQNVQTRRDNIVKLKQDFAALSKEDSSSPLLETLPASTQRTINEKLSQINHLKQMQKVVRILNTLAKQSQLLQHEPDAGKQRDIFSEILRTETDIWQMSKSTTNPLAAALATKGYVHCIETVHRPYQEQILDSFRKYLAEVKWPKELPSGDRFASLLRWSLQVEVRNRDSSPTSPVPLEVFKVLAEPLKLRFNYHFNSERETNRLDKPEWALNHIFGIVDEYKSFFTGVVQPFLPRDLFDKPLVALDEFITAILPIVYNKAVDSLDQLTEDSNLQSHWIEELVSFDNALCERYFYQPRDANSWRGVAGEILSRDGRFERWLKLESRTVHAQYSDIISSANAWDIDWESVDSFTTKPTLSSINLKNLFESVTQTYRSLRPISFRLRFLLDIQISLLDKYYTRLCESISAFESMSSTLSRAVGSVSAEDARLVTGINGLERLCRIYGSLDYMSLCLETWGQDLFFLDLWDDISRLSSGARDKETKKTGSARIPDNEDDEGTLFDETLTLYCKLKGRVQLAINSLVRKELQSGMRDYFRYGEWNLDASPQVMSSRLYQPIKNLTKYFLFLRKFYSQNSFMLFTREFSHQIENYIWNFIIQANRFNVNGGVQIQKDVNEIWLAFMLPRNRSWNRLQQACMLLSSDDRLGLPASPTQEDLENVQITDLSAEEAQGILRRRL